MELRNLRELIRLIDEFVAFTDDQETKIIGCKFYDSVYDTLKEFELEGDNKIRLDNIPTE